MRNSVFIWGGLIIGIILIVTACNKDVIIPRENGVVDDYYNMKLGTTWLYKVDSVYTVTNEPAAGYIFYIKDSVVEVVRNGKVKTYHVKRYRSETVDGRYEAYGSCELTISGNRLIHTGTDFNIIELNLPLVENRKWNNLYQDCNNAQSIIVNRVESDILNDNEYHDIMTVSHCVEFENNLRRQHLSRYAKDVGLIEQTIYKGFYNSLEGVTRATTITKSLLTYAY